MNAPTFDAHSSTCPICRHSDAPRSPQSLTGLLTCKQCQARLVISWSGHYVRDPFRLQYANNERMLRRESHPFYRILRDLQVTRFNFVLAILAGTLVVGVLGTLSNKSTPVLNSSLQPTADHKIP